MDDKYKFQKVFLLFANEDTSYDSGQVPSGYVKIEVRDGKAKLYSIVQNLKTQHTNFAYKLLLINPSAQVFKPITAGNYCMRENQAELKWEFDAKNISGSGRELDEYTVVTVMVDQVNSTASEIICPLVAYRGKKVEWRKVLRDENMQINKKEKAKIIDSGQQLNIKNQQIVTSSEEIVSANEIRTKPEVQVDSARLIMANKQADINKQVDINKQGDINRQVDINKQGDINKLKECFEQSFERSEPFKSRRREYKWWKVSSPVYLNNMLYQCNIKTPLMFNPLVMMAHFKYRHLIAGIYSDRNKKQEYFVCGIPGAYNVDERPFGEMCRWVQSDTGRLQYGTFGYWLVFIEPKSGKFVAFE